jgi:predicted mannosyl-3-phosphoglycerate phosphatase (HAD superfamily)
MCVWLLTLIEDRPTTLTNALGPRLKRKPETESVRFCCGEWAAKVRYNDSATVNWFTCAGLVPGGYIAEPGLLQTPAILFCDIDGLVPVRGRIAPGFDEFIAALEHAAIPNVWVTTRTRLLIDDPRRKLGHNSPFIAEGGCGVYLPEGYFHLRPAKTLRLGRFTCLPIAEPQRAAEEALEELSAETGVSVVPLRSLSPRELAQNAGLPAAQAELMRQPDFDEIFFFAGATEDEVKHFVAASTERHCQLRQRGALWSLAVGASLKQCVRELSKLYARALRSQPKIIGISREDGDLELLAACDRGFVLVDGAQREDDSESQRERLPARFRQVELGSPDIWERIIEAVSVKS